MLKINGTNVTIMVRDMDKTLNFYLSLGLNLLQRWDNHYAMVGTIGITIGIHPAEGQKLTSGSVSIGFMIDDVAEGKKMLTENKIEFKEENDENSGIYLHFKDLDGTTLYFVQPKW